VLGHVTTLFNTFVSDSSWDSTSFVVVISVLLAKCFVLPICIKLGENGFLEEP
jgi:hypothetical protein